MKLNNGISFFILSLCISIVSCTQKPNTNLTTEPQAADPRTATFFNALGLPLFELDADCPECIAEDLKRVAAVFTNEVDGKKKFSEEGEEIEDVDTRPFMMLAKNVGLYFTSQIWKTQLTAPEDVRFFDLGKTVNDPATGISFDSNSFNLPGVFLNPYADKTDPNNYLGSVVNGIYGKMNPQTGKLDLKISHFYIMEYKLRDENGSRVGSGVRTYYALVSVPVQTEVSKQVRLIMYAHGGDFGTSTSPIINSLHTKLKDHVVVAPLFPGEPLCTQIPVQGTGCMRFDAFNNLMTDNVGKFNNPYLPNTIFNSVVPIPYQRSPLNEDITSFLGAHNAVSRVMNKSLNGTNPFYSNSLENNTVLLTLPHPEQLLNFFQADEDYVVPRMVPTDLAPQTIGLGNSRGGSVLLNSLGRIGFFMNGASLTTQFKHTVDDDGTSFEFQYPLFNSAAVFYAPTSILTGKLRMMTTMLLENNVKSIAQVPMALDLCENEFFSNFRNDQSYFSEIQPPIEVEEGKFIRATDSLTQLATFVAANDITFLAPFVTTALQNWSTYHFENNVRAPGSLILLHGSQDEVVPLTESTIAAQAMNTVWAGLYNTTMDPYGNYLDPERFAAMHSVLKGSFIPGVGVAQYTFQPTHNFFNKPCDFSMLIGIEQPDIIYNSDIGRCFGEGYSPTADGNNLVGQGQIFGHSDTSFYTSRLVNPIDRDLLPIAALSSNIFHKYQTNYDFEFDAKRNMRFGGPTFTGYGDTVKCVAGVDDCSFYYDIALNSPTFMRYMSEEGKLAQDIVFSKKYIFTGDFMSKNTSDVIPHDVFFAWLESVACDKCEPIAGSSVSNFPTHFGVFHDFDASRSVE